MRNVCSTLLLALLCSADHLRAQELNQVRQSAGEQKLDWSGYRVTTVDLCVGQSLPFQHGSPELSRNEVQAYLELLRAIPERRFASQVNAAGEPLTVTATENSWEAAFYKYEHVRQRLWQQEQSVATGQQVPWAMMDDLLRHPNAFVGRPIVLYGLYRPSGLVQLDGMGRTVFDPDSGSVRLQRGFLRNLLDTQDVAIVDAMGYFGPNNQLKANSTWPADPGTALPVLVKGWFVKLWGQRPLIVTESVRILTPRPYDELIREYVRSRTPLLDDEKWLYYETLHQLRLTRGDAQAQLASVLQYRRLDELMGELRERTAAETRQLERDNRKGILSDDEFQVRRTRLDRQLGSRLQRYMEYQRHPSRFPLFVDMFQHPDHWQGKLVTLSGHVRRVITYAGDAEMSGGQPFHELWLYTDDSQHNPAVVVTAGLPADFPTEAEVVDRVTVTGCFFKMYVYRADREHRIAPLILCGRIGWNPTDDQILQLTAEGALPAGSALSVAARRRADSGISDTAVMLFGFLGIVVMMAVWGRVQRDRRERRRLLELVDSRRHFDQTADLVLSQRTPPGTSYS